MNRDACTPAMICPLLSGRHNFSKRGSTGESWHLFESALARSMTTGTVNDA
jgi:hypothetical protein